MIPDNFWRDVFGHLPIWITLQGTNISHRWKRKVIFKSALVGDVLVSWGVLFGDNFIPKDLAVFLIAQTFPRARMLLVSLRPRKNPWISPSSLQWHGSPMATLWYWGSDNGRQGWCIFLLNELFGTPESSKSQGRLDFSGISRSKIHQHDRV